MPEQPQNRMSTRQGNHTPRPTTSHGPIPPTTRIASRPLPLPRSPPVPPPGPLPTKHDVTAPVQRPTFPLPLEEDHPPLRTPRLQGTSWTMDQETPARHMPGVGDGEAASRILAWLTPHPEMKQRSVKSTVITPATEARKAMAAKAGPPAADPPESAMGL